MSELFLSQKHRMPDELIFRQENSTEQASQPTEAVENVFFVGSEKLVF